MLVFLKANFVPTLIISAAAALVVLASIPLAQTGWAENFRSRSGGERSEHMDEAHNEHRTREARDMGILIYVAPLFKAAILMGVGGLATALVRAFVTLISIGIRVLRGAT
jgi:hypothetical protein